jgi:hypothetical protein
LSGIRLALNDVVIPDVQRFAMEEYVIQRRFPRYRITLPVLYRFTPGSGGVGAGWTRDLSEGGSCVELDERLWPGTPLQFRLHTDRGSIELKAQVAWSGQSNPDGGNIHGLTFIQVPAPQRQALRDLLRTKEDTRESGIRVPLVLAVSCRPKGRTGPPLYGRTGDISRGGLSLRLLHAFPPGMKMEITLHTPKGPIPAEGMIAWVAPPERRRPGQLIQHGLRFTTLDWSTSLSLGLVAAESA